MNSKLCKVILSILSGVNFIIVVTGVRIKVTFIFRSYYVGVIKLHKKPIGKLRDNKADSDLSLLSVDIVKTNLKKVKF